MKKYQKYPTEKAWERNSQVGGLALAETCVRRIMPSEQSTADQRERAAQILLELASLRTSCAAEKRNPETGYTIPAKKEPRT